MSIPFLFENTPQLPFHCEKSENAYPQFSDLNPSLICIFFLPPHPICSSLFTYCMIRTTIVMDYIVRERAWNISSQSTHLQPKKKNEKMMSGPISKLFEPNLIDYQFTNQNIKKEN